MKLPQLLHSTRSYGRANSAFSWKLLVLERGFLSYRLKSPYDRSAKDAWYGYSPVGALRKLPFILYSRPAEDWLQRSGSSSTISPTTLFFEISAGGRHNYSRSSTPVARANKLPWPTGGVFSRKSRPVISTLPSSVSCRRRSFRSAIISNRVRWRWNAWMHRSGVGR